MTHQSVCRMIRNAPLKISKSLKKAENGPLAKISSQSPIEKWIYNEKINILKVILLFLPSTKLLYDGSSQVMQLSRAFLPWLCNVLNYEICHCCTGVCDIKYINHYLTHVYLFLSGFGLVNVFLFFFVLFCFFFFWGGGGVAWKCF